MFASISFRVTDRITISLGLREAFALVIWLLS